MRKIIIIVFAVFNLSFVNFSMSYAIEANLKTKCKDEFPSGLSFFFEQIGGFGEKSMVSQVEKILKINLSTFQEYYNYTDEDESSKKYWKNIDQFSSVVDLLISKIKANPKYFEKVKFNPVMQDDFSYNAKGRAKQKEYEKSPLYGYPYDTKYLSSKAILKDLETLKSILNCYKKSGATKIRLSYG